MIKNPQYCYVDKRAQIYIKMWATITNNLCWLILHNFDNYYLYRCTLKKELIIELRYLFKFHYSMHDELIDTIRLVLNIERRKNVIQLLLALF